MLRGRTHSESVLVCVEAKVDEPFGVTIGENWHTAKNRQKPTRAPERIAALLEIVFGAAAQPDHSPWRNLRYQLLTGIAGTLIQAANEKAPLAVFVVHEFRMSTAKPTLLQTNAEDYYAFVKELFKIQAVSEMQLYGPLPFHKGSHLSHPVELFVGKAFRFDDVSKP